jgi:hypothetical protein
MCCLASLFSGGGGWGDVLIELLIDGGDGFHDAFKDFLLVFEFGCDGVDSFEREFDLFLEFGLS